jgi:hypothetical protein
MCLFYFILYALLSVLFILSLSLAAKRITPCLEIAEKGGNRIFVDSQANRIMRIRDKLGIPIYVMDLPCVMFKSRGCICRHEVRVLHSAKSVL